MLSKCVNDCCMTAFLVNNDLEYSRSAEAWTQSLLFGMEYEYKFVCHRYRTWSSPAYMIRLSSWNPVNSTTRAVEIDPRRLQKETKLAPTNRGPRIPC